MASSGSVDWTATRNQIIRMAALDLQAIGAGVTMSAEMLQDFDWSLNAMVKAWNATGIHVWTVAEAALFPQPVQVTYEVGAGATDHVTQTYVQAEVAENAASGATSIEVDSITGFADGDNIGIVLSDGSIHWTTVSGTPSGTTITLAVALTDTSLEGQLVFGYTTRIVRPLRIVAARRHDVDADTDTDIAVVARADYHRLPLKNQVGTINQLFYDPQLGKGLIHLWQPVEAWSHLVKFTWHRPIEDFDSAGNNPDLPQEWIMALRYNLAESMFAQFPVSDAIARRVTGLAAKYFDAVAGHDRENESISFAPDMGP